jgi:hypothetical protein
MDDNAELDRFARLLMGLVRDRAIGECDRLSRGSVRGPIGERWQEVMAQESPQDALLELIPEVVDQTLFQFLDAIDNGGLPLRWEGEDGSVEPLIEIGSKEMAGWLAGGDWPDRYSNERRHDYFSDLRLVEPEDT